MLAQLCSSIMRALSGCYFHTALAERLNKEDLKSMPSVEPLFFRVVRTKKFADVRVTLVLPSLSDGREPTVVQRPT